MTGAFIYLSIQKGARAEVLFRHSFRSRQNFGVAEDFFPNFPELPPKAFCATFAHKFSPTMITVCLCDFQKGLHVFLRKL